MHVRRGRSLIFAHTLYVFEENGHRHRNQILNRKWCCDRQVPERYEICLLRVKVNIASNAVGI